MSVERALTAFAGFMILLSVALTYWFQQSFTGFCPASIFMKKALGLKTERELEKAGK